LDSFDSTIALQPTALQHSQPISQVKKAYFISDLHLGATYLSAPKTHEQRVVRFLESIADDAAELYLLGDILDYWYEYRTVAPKGFTRFFGTLGRLSDRGVKITWFIGNHDIWLFDYLRNEIGMTVVDGFSVRTILGKKFFLSHGDGLGKPAPMFKFIRAVFRNRICQKLYATIHPRWTIPFAHRWSAHSRDFANSNPRFEGEEKEPFIKFCREYLQQDPSIDYFVLGHRHILLDFPLGTQNSRMIVLGDWIHHFSYGVFDGKNFELRIFSEENRHRANAPFFTNSQPECNI